MQCVANRRASLLADALAFVVPHRVDKQHLAAYPGCPIGASRPNLGLGRSA
jgi:hypothetical protein